MKNPFYRCLNTIIDIRLIKTVSKCTSSDSQAAEGVRHYLTFQIVDSNNVWTELMSEENLQQELTKLEGLLGDYYA